MVDLFVCFWGFQKLSFEILWEFVRQLMVLVPNTIMCRGPDQRLRTWSSVGKFCWYNIRVKLFSKIQQRGFLQLVTKCFAMVECLFVFCKTRWDFGFMSKMKKRLSANFLEKIREKVLFEGGPGWHCSLDRGETTWWRALPPFSGKVTFVKTTRS